AGGRRYRALRTYQKRGRHGDCRGYRYLPDENLADRLAQAGKHGALSFHARQIRKIITHASLRSAQLVQKLVKVIEARVVHHELAGALLSRADLDRGAEPLRCFFLEAREVAVARLAAARGRAAQQPLHHGLGVAYRQAFRRHALAELDLARAVEREQRTRVAHLERT